MALYLDGIDKPVNVLSVTEIFTRRKRLHEIGGVDYLSQLVVAEKNVKGSRCKLCPNCQEERA
ncbi:hypothetical protein [Paenibacillus larvae]|uniref:hypothetical protein n=1 Tax=Paenibacillus larvae TaxID=1464 RepID=UPI00289255B4|nr:hypothetical protein [Paenibacillus larvae]MDT2191037.1 hypothetical protein [Paenibacillus larvae]